MIDRTEQEAERIWISVTASDGPEWAASRGEAVRLKNGNTLVNYGTGGVIREVTPAKKTVFYVKFDITRRTTTSTSSSATTSSSTISTR